MLATGFSERPEHSQLQLYANLERLIRETHLLDEATGTTEASKRAYSGRLIDVDVETVRLPNGERVELELIRHPGAAAVVPLLSDPTAADPAVLLLRQFRHAAGGTIWEIPAGTLKANEAPEECARRELTEETGATADKIEYLTTIYTTPGFTDEKIHLFMASGIRAGEPSREAGELIETEVRPMSRILEMIRDGDICDAKSIVGLLYVAGYRLTK